MLLQLLLNVDKVRLVWVEPDNRTYSRTAYYLLFAEEAVVGHDCVAAHATPVPAVRVVGVLLLHGLQPGLVVALKLLLQDLATQLA